ncbi:MAG: 30S ribosomal protein S4e [Candidatus Methylarchaceae archaeon HK02M1]|nr:30S ribosomal protein S4e [Candidatus Methylarchaceae archaeon HK01M]MCP8312530.1 30S ribosomal protein S4e [Candidatus Methylarchaceae archaeon HK02M1]
MVKMGEDKRTKRSEAPAFWKIPRKKLRFTVTVPPGPHPKKESYPIAVLIRDILGLVKTYREAKSVIHEGKILVDGIPRRTPDFPSGLMDVIDIPSIGKTFRLVPILGHPLHPITIHESEKSLKLCKVKVKKTVKGGQIQYGLHDGRSILLSNGVDLNPGDTYLIEIPSQKIIGSVQLQEGTLAIIIRGTKVGQLGKVEKIKPGTFSRPKMVSMSIGSISTELPSDIIFVVGDEKPLIKIGGEI